MPNSKEKPSTLKIPKQAEGVVDAGVTALLHWNEDTNTAATAETRSGSFVAESEHEEVRLVVEAAAAAAVHHLDTDVNATAIDSEHEEGRLVAEAAEAAAATAKEKPKRRDAMS